MIEQKKSIPCASWVLTILATVLLSSVSSTANASVAGCTAFNGLDYTPTPGSSGGNPGIYNAGEYFTFTLTDQGSTSDYKITYVDNNDAGNNITKTGSLTSNQVKKITLTIPVTSSNAEITLFNLGSSAGNINYAVTCVDEAPISNPASTTPAVASAVARSQTTVIQQNISARVSAVINGASNTVRSESPTSQTVDPVNMAGYSSFLQSDEPSGYTTNNTDQALRQLAMIGNFDSSQIATSSISAKGLGVGAGDQGDNSGVGGGTDGRSALVSSSPFTVWGHGSYTNVDNDFNQGTTDNRYNGDVWGYNVGLDYRFTNALTAGLSVGYNDTDLSTDFNTNGTYREKAVVVAGYAIYSPLNNVTVTMEGGYSVGDVDVTRDSGSVTGNTDSTMWYGAVAASYSYRPQEDHPLSLKPSISLVAARKTIDGFTESDNTVVSEERSHLGQIKPQLEAAYDIRTSIVTLTPFVSAGFIYDYDDKLNDDATAYDVGGGFRVSNSDLDLNGSLEVNYVGGREDYREYTIAGTVTYGFALFDDKGTNLGIVSPFLGSNLDEYGNQRFRAGFGYRHKGLNSSLTMNHQLSSDSTDANINANTGVQLSISIDF